MSCKGLHCPGCGDGPGGLAIIVALLLAGAVIARPVAHIAAEVLHVILLAAAVLAGVTVAGLGTWAVVALTRRRRHAIPPAPPPRVVVHHHWHVIAPGTEPLAQWTEQRQLEPKETRR